MKRHLGLGLVAVAIITLSFAGSIKKSEKPKAKPKQQLSMKKIITVENGYPPGYVENGEQPEAKTVSSNEGWRSSPVVGDVVDGKFVPLEKPKTPIHAKPKETTAEIASRIHNERKQAKLRDIQKRRMIRQAEIEQQRQNQAHYLSVVVPQQQEAAQRSFNNSMEFQRSMQREQMIYLQRERNFLLQEQIWNQQRRQPIYYGVPPYGIDLRYP